jgi:hypothetical protein
MWQDLGEVRNYFSSCHYFLQVRTGKSIRKLIFFNCFPESRLPVLSVYKPAAERPEERSQELAFVQASWNFLVLIPETYLVA